MAFDTSLDRAREAFSRHSWRDVWSAYSAASRDAVLTLDDIWRFAIAAHLLGLETECLGLLEQGYRESLRLDDVTRAARFAYWRGHGSVVTGNIGQAGGWFSRARTLLSELAVDCVEWGYLQVPDGWEHMFAGDYLAACKTFSDVDAIAGRFGDLDLLAISGHGRGRALLRLGMIGEGMAALDEVMVAVAAGDVTPMAVGDVYCGVIEACWEAFDVRRAREWTAALSKWCEGQPDLVPYRGPCLVHRVELMRLHGDWEDALEEARRACEWLALPASPEGPADALYQLAELHRLRGDFATAEEAYRDASRAGRQPEPGLSLLWLARGRADAAKTAVGRALAESGQDRVRLVALLRAYVEISLALGDVAGARSAAGELTAMAAAFDAPMLEASAEMALGNVLIAESDAQASLAHLRRSWIVFQELDAPYEAARIRVLIGRALAALGDGDSATMEFDAAGFVFDRLGAFHDLAGLALDLPSVRPRSPSDGLSPRELEVLGLIAAGRTNKAIAAALVISEHTVARHVQNMLSKLGFSSRSSLATYATEQRIARPERG